MIWHESQKRVEQYTIKVKKAAGEHELSKLRPKTTLNVAAAARFIDHAIPDLTPEQRQRMKQVWTGLWIWVSLQLSSSNVSVSSMILLCRLVTGTSKMRPSQGKAAQAISEG